MKPFVKPFAIDRRGPGTPVSPRRRGRVVLLLTLFSMMTALLARSSAAGDGTTFIKFACLAPEGSLWVKIQREWDRELREKTKGKLAFKIFSGGILGEELDAVRKMRAGQIQATSITGIATGQIVPSARVFELPGLLKSYAQLDAAKEATQDYFRNAFLDKGYVLLGFTEVGPVHIFSSKPFSDISDLKGHKLWIVDGDPISTEVARQFGFSSISLSLLNVLPSLQTGVVDTLYGSPLGVVAMQWHTHMRYVLDEPLGIAIGVWLMDRKTFEGLSPDERDIMKELGAKYTNEIVAKVREANGKAMNFMVNRQGLKRIHLNRSRRAELEIQAREVWKALEGTIYDPALLATVREAAATVPVKGESEW